MSARTPMDAWQAHCDLMHVIDGTPLTYTEFLEVMIAEIREFAEPLRHAVLTNPPRGINDTSIIAVQTGFKQYEWLDGEPEIPLPFGYLKSLLYTIDDDFPVIKIPDYDA